MRLSKQLLPRVRWSLGASTASIVITLTVLVALGICGWLGNSYYQLLNRVRKLEHSLDLVHRYRGANRVTRARILKNAMEKLRAAGGRPEARDISLQLTALTLENGKQLPRMMRTKLTMKCHLQKIDGVRDNRIARIKKRFENAGRPIAPAPRPATTPIAPPDLKGGLGCSADRLAELDYTFVVITAKVTAKSGLFSRSVTVIRKFFLPQSPSDAQPGDNDSDDDDDE